MKNKMKNYVGDWVIVHYEQYGMKKQEVGKLSKVGDKVIVLDAFTGSFEKGCLASASSIPLDVVNKVFNKKCEVIYESE